MRFQAFRWVIAGAAAAGLALPLGLAPSGAAAEPVAPRPRGSEPLPIHLPQDQAAHPAALNEWWYIIGHVWSGNREFGFEIDLNRFGLFRDQPLLWRSDLAITDVSANRHTAELTPFPEFAGSASPTTLDVQLPNARIFGASLESFDAQAQVVGGDTHPSGSISIHLKSRKVPMLVGGTGFLPFGDGFTYYYSLTDLKAVGTLVFQGKAYPVRGYAWLDHQWGDWSWSSLPGWTWFPIQLDNGVQLNLGRIKENGEIVTQGFALLRNGRQRAIPDFTVTPIGQPWTSPHAGRIYNTEWLVRIPSARSEFRIRTLVLDQELPDTLFPASSLYEGTCSVRGTWEGKRVTGRSYVEQIGSFE